MYLYYVILLLILTLNPILSEQLIFGSRKLLQYSILDSSQQDQQITNVITKQYGHLIYFYVGTDKGNIYTLEQNTNNPQQNKIQQKSKINLKTNTPIQQMFKLENQDILFILSEQISQNFSSNMLIYQIQNKKLKQLTIKFPESIANKKINYCTVYEDKYLFLGIKNKLILAEIDIQNKNIIYISDIALGNMDQQQEEGYPIRFIDVQQGMKMVGVCQKRQKYFTLIDISNNTQMKIIYAPDWIDHEDIKNLLFIPNSNQFLVQSPFYQFIYSLDKYYENQNEQLGFENPLNFTKKTVAQGYYNGIQLINQGTQICFQVNSLGLMLINAENLNEYKSQQIIKKNIRHSSFIIQELSNVNYLIFFENSSLEIYQSIEKNSFLDFPSFFNSQNTHIYSPPDDQNEGWPWRINLFKNQTKLVATFGQRGIEFLDITNIPNLEYISNFNFGLEKKLVGIHEATLYEKNEDILFVTNSESGFFALDIQDLQDIKILHQYDLEGDLDHIVQFKKREPEKNIFIIAAGFQGFYSVEISKDLSNLQVLSNFKTTESVEGLALNPEETIAYIAIRNYGFKVFDISNLYEIKLLHFVQTDSFESVRIFEDYNPNILVVSQGIQGVYFYDISNPIYKEPELISHVYTDMSTYRTALTNDKKNIISVGIGQHQVIIIDIKDIKNPYIKSRFSESKGAIGLQILNNHALVSFQQPLSLRAFNLLPETEVNFEFYNIKDKDYEFLKKDSPLYIGQKIELKAVYLSDFEDYKLFKVKYYDQSNLIDLPRWIQFQQSQEQLTLDIIKESMGVNIIVFQTFKKVKKSHFSSCLKDQSNLSDQEAEEISSLIFKELELQNVIDYQFFPISVEKISSISFLNKDLLQYSPLVVKELEKHIISNPLTFKVLSSLEFHPQQQQNIVTTKSQEDVTIELRIEKSQGTFIQQQFQGVISSFYEENTQDILQIEGGIRSINTSLNQLRVHLKNYNIQEIQIQVKIQDQINDELIQTHTLDELSFISLNKPVILNDNIQQQFNFQLETRSGEIFVDEEFQFNLSPQTFIDEDDTIEISALFLKGEEYIQIPSNHWLFYSSSTRLITGNPTLDNFKDKTTLKFIATDGFYSVEDTLIINPSRLGFMTVFLYMLKLIGPIMTIILFLYRFRVQIHSFIFYSQFTHGIETYTPLEFFQKQIPLTLNSIKNCQIIFKYIDIKTVKRISQKQKVNLDFIEYFHEIQRTIYAEKMNNIKLDTDFNQIAFKALACLYLISQNPELKKHLKQLKQFALKDLSPQYSKREWFKYYIKLKCVEIQSKNQQQIPEIQIIQEKIQIILKNLCKRYQEILIHVLIGYTLGITDIKSINRGLSGESLLIEDSQMHNIISLKEQHECPKSKNYFLKFKKKLHLNYSPIEMSKNRQLPDWLDYEIENNILHIFGTPPPLYTDNLMIRIQDSHGYILRQFKLQISENFINQSLINQICTSPPGKQKIEILANQQSISNSFSMKRSQVSKQQFEQQKQKQLFSLVQLQNMNQESESELNKPRRSYSTQCSPGLFPKLNSASVEDIKPAVVNYKNHDQQRKSSHFQISVCNESPSQRIQQESSLDYITDRHFKDIDIQLNDYEIYEPQACQVKTNRLSKKESNEHNL